MFGMNNEPIPGGHISVGAMPRSYQVTPGILGRRRATQPKKVRPTADSMEKGQPAADREPSRPRRTPPRRRVQALTDMESANRLSRSGGHSPQSAHGW
jgi:hypothetical protein